MANFWVFQTFLINIFCILTNKKTTANFLCIDRNQALEGDCTWKNFANGANGANGATMY